MRSTKAAAQKLISEFAAEKRSSAFVKIDRQAIVNGLTVRVQDPYLMYAPAPPTSIAK